MKRRFIVAAEGLTSEAEGKLVEYFREKKLGWWHHIANFWLVVDHNDKVTASELRDKIATLRPSGSPILVMQIPKQVSWQGMRPDAKADMFSWLEKTWTPD